MTWVGVTLLAVGFGLQLAGYVVAADDDWFFLAAVAVIAVATGGGWAASRGLARLFQRIAVRNAPWLQQEVLRQQREEREHS